MLPFPICYISDQAADMPIRVPLKEEVDDGFKIMAELFVSAVNGRDESALQEIFAQGLIWESGNGYIKGDKDRLVKIYKYNWSARKGWHIVLRTVKNAYIVGSVFRDRIPENNVMTVVKLVKLDVTQEYEHTFTDGENAKITDYYPIYLSFENRKVVRVIFGPSSLAP